jgi:GTP pyrophosphokinase
MVEILTSKTQRPSPDWLDIVGTSRARNKVRSYLRAEQRLQSRQVGLDVLEKGLRRYGCSYPKMLKQGDVDRVVSGLRFGNVEDLLTAVGSGKLDKDDVIDRLLPEEKREKPPSKIKEGPIEKVIRKVRGDDKGIVIDGLDNLLVHFARCCSPLPGENVMGYISRGRGVVIHRRDCQRASTLDPERKTNVTWSAKAVSQRPVKLRVVTDDRPGVLATLSTIFQNNDVNLNSANCVSGEGNTATNTFTFLVKDLSELNRIIRALKNVKSVLDVNRVHD